MTSTGRSSNARWSVRRAFQAVNTGEVVKATGNVGSLKIMSAESNFKRHYDDAKNASQPDVFYAVAVRAQGAGGQQLLLPLFIYGTKADIQQELSRGLIQDSSNTNIVIDRPALQWAAIYRAALSEGNQYSDRNVIYLTRQQPNLPDEITQNPAYANLTKAGVLKDAERLEQLVKNKGFEKKTATVRDTSRRIGGQRDPLYQKFFNLHSNKDKYRNLGLVISAKQNNGGPGKVEVKFMNEIKSAQAAGKLFPAGGEVRVFGRGGRNGDRSQAMNNILTFFTRLRADAAADQQNGTYAGSDVPIGAMIESLASIIAALSATGAQAVQGAFAGAGLAQVAQPGAGFAPLAPGAAGFAAVAPGAGGAGAFAGGAPGFAAGSAGAAGGNGSQRAASPGNGGQSQFAAGGASGFGSAAGGAGAAGQSGFGGAGLGGQSGAFGGGAPGFGGAGAAGQTGFGGAGQSQLGGAGFGGGAPSAMMTPPGVGGGFGSPSGTSSQAVQSGF